MCLQPFSLQGECVWGYQVGAGANRCYWIYERRFLSLFRLEIPALMSLWGMSSRHCACGSYLDVSTSKKQSLHSLPPLLPQGWLVSAVRWISSVPCGFFGIWTTADGWWGFWGRLCDSLLSWRGVIPARWSQDHHFRSGLRSFPFKTRFSTHDVSLRSWSFLDRDKRLQEPSRVSTVSGVHSNQDKYLQKMFRLICALNLIFGATLQGRPEKQVPLWFMVLA